MYAIAIFLGMSLDIGGVGGLLSGIFARSFRRAMMWAAGFGVLNVVIGWLVRDVPHFAPSIVFMLIALFWGLIGWFAIGRHIARWRAAKTAKAAINT
ncbi:hypothetical protein OO012_18250 [Rhodobacteraceae bacterium KMM 6894]|nr:hypothetical protein [Rhodobacteraceae bacterium KMM 6894]